MKLQLGRKFSTYQIQDLGITSAELQAGRCSMNHPRCGRIVIEVMITPDVFGRSIWEVTSIEKPDK